MIENSSSHEDLYAIRSQDSLTKKKFKEFRKICFSEFVFTTYLFSLIPQVFFIKGVYPLIGALVLFLSGLIIEGVWNGWSVEHYSRKKLFIYGIFGSLLPAFLLMFNGRGLGIVLSFFICGYCAAMVENSMCHTAANDLLTSGNRTKGDSELFKYTHLGIPLGLFLGSISLPLGNEMLLNGLLNRALACLPSSPYFEHFGIGRLLPLAMGVLAVVLALQVNIPLKAPIETRLFSLDRFWKSGATPLVLVTLIVSLVEGIGLSLILTATAVGVYKVAFYFLCGFVLWALVHNYFFKYADDRAEFVVGCLMLVIGGGLIFLSQKDKDFFDISYGKVGFVFWGLGTTSLVNRLQMYFLKLDGHNDRATLQNTHYLSWTFGLFLGLIGALLHIRGFLLKTQYPIDGILANNKDLMCIALLLVIFSLLFYLFYLHRWFERHRDRGFKFNGY